MILWTKPALKGNVRLERKKSEYHLWILHTWISLGPKFQLKLTILIFWIKFISSLKGIQWNRHWVLHIWNSLGTKFQLKLTILIFWTKFLKKCISGMKQKNHPFACVHSRYLYYIKLFRMGANRHFNVSSPSSRRNNNEPNLRKWQET